MTRKSLGNNTLNLFKLCSPFTVMQGLCKILEFVKKDIAKTKVDNIFGPDIQAEMQHSKDEGTFNLSKFIHSKVITEYKCGGPYHAPTCKYDFTVLSQIPDTFIMARKEKENYLFSNKVMNGVNMLKYIDNEYLEPKVEIEGEKKEIEMSGAVTSVGWHICGNKTFETAF